MANDIVVTATDNILPDPQNIQIVSNPTIEDHEIYATDTIIPSDQTRVTQQVIQPSAVTNRAISDLFTILPGNNLVYAIQYNLPDSSSLTGIFSASDSQGRQIAAIPNVAFYVGQNVSGANRWPNANFGEGNMPTSVFNEWYDPRNPSNTGKVFTKCVIRNNTGSTQRVFIYLTYVVIANPGGNKGSISN